MRTSPNPDLVVMYHGNRFPLARPLSEAFERQNPGVRIAYSAVPPAHTLEKLRGMTPRVPALAELPLPDVVMLPPTIARMLPGKLGETRLYSQVNGLVLVARADDARITGPMAAVERDDVKWVVPGLQFPSHGIFAGMRKFYGDAVLDRLLAAERTGYSQLTHHRSIPARILVGCEDVAVQFAQSRPYLEARFPGRFKFFALPGVDATVMRDEDSVIAITREAAHPELAKRFVDFMFSDAAQAILADYGVARQP